MLGRLEPHQIEEILHSQFIGRIGCHAGDTTYIVPISYAYDGVNIFGRSEHGMKVDIMRKNPNICFEVEQVTDMANWKTVIMWGKFVEITEAEERNYALQQLLNRRLPVVTSELTKFTPNWPFNSQDVNNVEGVVYRIDLFEKTGRFENYLGAEAEQPYL